MDSFRSVIDAWPKIDDFADDAGISIALARVWKTRDSIPASHWDSVVAGAKRRRIAGVSFPIFSALVRKRSVA